MTIVEGKLYLSEDGTERVVVGAASSVSIMFRHAYGSRQPKGVCGALKPERFVQRFPSGPHELEKEDR